VQQPQTTRGADDQPRGNQQNPALQPGLSWCRPVNPDMAAVDIAIDVAPIDWDAIYMAAICMAAIRIAAIARDAPDATEFNLAAVGVTAIDWGTIDIAVVARGAFARDAFGVAAIGVAAITTDAFDAVTFGLAGRAWNPRCFALGPPLRPRSCIDMARALHRHRASGRPAERTRRRA
jgi:hypothetical protein